jgi:hypothetical protein
MNELLVVIVEEAGALRRELDREQGYHLNEHVRSYLEGRLHALESVERYLRRKLRIEA